MITSFKSIDTAIIFQGGISGNYPRSIQVNALRKLRAIDAATAIGDLQILGGLEKLLPISEIYNLAIDDRWRIQFIWLQPDKATEVDIVGAFGMGSRRNRLPNIHPGEVLQADLMKRLNLSVERLSTELGMTQDTLQGILEGRLNIDADIAARLASYFGNSQGFWQNLQRQFDSAQSGAGYTKPSYTVLDLFGNNSPDRDDDLPRRSRRRRDLDIFQLDEDDSDELDDDPPSRYRRRRDE